MKNRSRLVRWLSLLGLSFYLPNALAESATTTQTLSITVPLVALINVEDVSPTFTFIAPTQAGEGFSGQSTSTNKRTSIAVSSNNPNAKLNVKVDNDLSAHGFTVEMTEISGELGQCYDGTRLTTTNQTLCELGLRQTHNGEVLLKASLNENNSMIPYGTYTTNITYTISEN
jgi:hypothetical protein